MLHLLTIFLLPPILVFSIYHIVLWLGWGRFLERSVWRRVALASGLGHVLLAAGFFTFVWIDYRQTALDLPGASVSLAGHLFESGGFSTVMWVLDPLPTGVLLGLLTAMSRAGIGGNAAFPMTVLTFLSVGTFQWYWIGGAVARVSGRIGSALRTPGDDLPDWF